MNLEVSNIVEKITDEHICEIKSLKQSIEDIKTENQFYKEEIQKF